MLAIFRQLLRRLFRRPAPPEKGVGIYIDGYIYQRSGAHLCITPPGTKALLLARRGHVAPNGTPIVRITYALALLEGSTALALLGDSTSYPRRSK